MRTLKSMMNMIVLPGEPTHEDNKSGTIVGNEFRNKLSVLLSWLLALLVASCCGI